MISILRPLLAVAVAILAALAVLLLDKREKLRDAVSPLAAIAMFAIVASMAPNASPGGITGPHPTLKKCVIRVSMSCIVRFFTGGVANE